MAIPVYLWLTDDSGNPVKGSVDVRGREGSIEISEIMHALELPVDDLTGKITGPCVHGEMSFRKDIDSSTPYLSKGVSSGRRFKEAIFSYYRINYNGQEEEYFRVTLTDCRITDVNTFVLDIKDPRFEKHSHQEYVSINYANIEWHYLDGNIIHFHGWNERRTA